MENGPRVRIRLKFARLAPARNLTHLQQIKALREIAAASGLKCCSVKCGGSRAPRMAFGPAISVGYESLCEYADLYLAAFAGDAEAAEKIRSVKSQYYELISAKRVPIFFPSIEASVNAAEYLIEADSPEGFRQKDADAFLSRPQALYEKVKPSGAVEIIDARPLTLSALCGAPGTLELTLKFEPKKNVKPEIVAGMISPDRIKRIVRKELFWLDSKGRLEVF